MACQIDFLKTSLVESSDFRAARAPGIVCLRARSAWRARVVEWSSRTIRLSSAGVGSLGLVDASPMAIAPMVLPNISMRCLRTNGDGSVPSTYRNHFRI